MRKKVWIFLTILVLCVSLSDALKTVTIEEKDLVSLKPKAVDADFDELSYSFSEPFDENGEWQTDYGDAGEYEVTVTVSDGELDTSEEVLLIVEKNNVRPSIDLYSPKEEEIDIDEGEEVAFSVDASDLNKDELEYLWELDGDDVFEGKNYNYKSDYGDSGVHEIKVIVSDGDDDEEREWVVNVNKVDREMLLDGFNDLEVNEEDVVKFDLPDFEEYNLKYTISEPVGDDNFWQTTYDDSGLYDVEILIEDRDFSASKTVEVRVVDVDRDPVFKPIASAWMQENQKVVIDLEAEDLDGDDIVFSGENLPEGSKLEGNKFEWVVNYDAIQKDNSFEKVLDRFHVLFNAFKITFIAESKDKEVKRNAWIMIKDVNRAPELKDMADIEVNEGEEVIIEPEAVDKDGDGIVFSYSGWIQGDRYKTNFNDAGTYRVKVKASDGFLSSEKFVTIVIRDVNRAPVIGDVEGMEVKEGEKIEFRLTASDVDGDSVTISGDNLPNGANVEDNVFTWVPDYDTMNGSVGLVVLRFVGSDGEAESFKEVNVTVYNVNRAPKIVSVEPRKEISVYAGNKTKFEVFAEDPDGDELSYLWKFNLLEQYESEQAMMRKFTSAGNKKVKVVVSDGKEEVEYEWKVKVIEKKVKVVKKVEKKKEEPKKVVKKVEKKPEPKVIVKREVVTVPIKPAEPSRTGEIYDKYTIIHDDYGVKEESKENFVVWRG